jgi:prepilin-type N-terminal cleavage/methylation domain-containing protein
MPPTDRRQRGFTLVEVLVATVIMTVALVALAGMMAVTLRMQMLGRNQTNAVRMAQSKLDELAGVAQNDWGAAPVSVGGSLAANVTDFNDTPTSGYTRRWAVAAGPTDPSSQAGDLRVVTVRVIPALADNRATATVELTTILRNPAP